MIKWLISTLVAVSPLTQATEAAQYSNIGVYETGDRSGVSINFNTNTMLICEGPCYLKKISNVRFDNNIVYFTIDQHHYTFTLTFNKAILSAQSLTASPYYKSELLFKCTNTRPVNIKCWPHEKFKMRN